MLYDQAQLASLYLEAFKITEREYYATTARSILDYVLEKLTHSEGGFYCGEDADSMNEHGHKSEGAFYVWKQSGMSPSVHVDLQVEISDLFKDDELNERIAINVFGIQKGGNVDPQHDIRDELAGYNVLRNRIRTREKQEQAAASWGITTEELKSRVATIKKRMYEYREKRIRPHLDDKIVVEWNGLMISAFAKAGILLKEPRYLEAAEKAARFIQENMWNGTNLMRSYRLGPSSIGAFSADFASLIAGLLELYRATFSVTWLKFAAKLQATMDVLFWDPIHGGYLSHDKSDPYVISITKSFEESVMPSTVSCNCKTSSHSYRMA